MKYIIAAETKEKKRYYFSIVDSLSVVPEMEEHKKVVDVILALVGTMTNGERADLMRILKGEK